MSPWIGPGPDDGHLDHQVVEAGGPQPRQHGHLGPGLDLEHPGGLGALDHAVDRRVLRRDVRPWLRCRAAVAVDQVQGPADGAEHAQRQAVHLEQAQGVQVVLVPLDDGALRPWRRSRSAPAATARPREMTKPPTCWDRWRGKPSSSWHQAQECADQGVVRVEADLAQPLRGTSRPSHQMMFAGQAVHLIRGHAQGLAHVPHRAPRAGS